jgi:hypothetical protein
VRLYVAFLNETRYFKYKVVALIVYLDARRIIPARLSCIYEDELDSRTIFPVKLADAFAIEGIKRR